ncbi:hypothetical protein [Brevibacillus laterosporus]|uniref:hypothetical protein n=1 Tax=Brevibacillus laterosporus TaxID=1465 RepID=UPI003D2075C6
MIKFDFVTDKDANEYCQKIIKKMSECFGITEEEAIGRVNKKWKGISFFGDDHIIYHELEDFWAYDIYYGSDSRWWARKDDLDLKPIPFPEQ